ncbi:MAG: transposase [Rikenellaceae bacterium]|nr:transposase [Rikenellaceae bacterium]
MIKSSGTAQSLFASLDDMLNQRHVLYRLAHKVNWQRFENMFSPLYCHNNGRPGKPIRLMCGLLMLKILRKISDEVVVEQWSENAYFQYFCGMNEFVPAFPCNASELVHFRKRIGQEGLDAIAEECARLTEEEKRAAEEKEAEKQKQEPGK